MFRDFAPKMEPCLGILLQKQAIFKQIFRKFLKNGPMFPGGVTFTKIVRGCACRTSKIWLSLYQFFAKFPTYQYTIFERNAPNFDRIGCFLQ